MSETSTLAKVLTWLIIGTVIVLALKIVVPLVTAVFTLTVALTMVAAPIVVIGALCYLVYRVLQGRNAY